MPASAYDSPAMTLGLGEGSSAAASFLSLLDFTFNRVEGLHLGAGKEFDSLLTRATISAGAAYGFSDQRWKYHAGFMLFTSRERTLGVGAEGYRVLAPVPDQGYYGPMFIGLGCLLAKQDYQDYYRTEGYRFRLTAVPTPLVRATLTFTDEWERSEPKRTDYSFIYPSRDYRENPAIEDGMMRSLGLNVRVGNEPIPLDIVTSDALELAIEHSSPLLARSSFDFTRYFAVGSLSVPTFSRSSLFPQLIRMRVAAGTSSGDLPPQRLFGVESALCSFSPFGTMHALQPRELTGTGFVSANVEHNFRSIPFLALGIPFLYEHNIELIVHGGAARVWGSSAPGADRVYWEAGCAISRIFELFRTDFTWRLSAPTRFAFTLGIAQIL